jgi:dihydroorotate dehydrogenase (fumarate)
MTHEVYLEHLRRAKEAVKIPIMASLNGATTGRLGAVCQGYGAGRRDAIELNTYALATDRSQTRPNWKCSCWNW